MCYKATQPLLLQYIYTFTTMLYSYKYAMTVMCHSVARKYGAVQLCSCAAMPMQLYHYAAMTQCSYAAMQLHSFCSSSTAPT